MHCGWISSELTDRGRGGPKRRQGEEQAGCVLIEHADEVLRVDHGDDVKLHQMLHQTGNIVPPSEAQRQQSPPLILPELTGQFDI